MTWPWSKAAAVVTAWQEWGPDQPDEIWSSCHLANAARRHAHRLGRRVLPRHLRRSAERVDRLADRIGSPARSVSLRRRPLRGGDGGVRGLLVASPRTPVPPAGHDPGPQPAGRPRRETYAAPSDFFDRSLSAAGLADAPGAEARPRPSGGGAGSIALTALGGAVNRVAPTATAFVHRRSRMLAQYIASWRAGTAGTTAQSWLTGAHASMAPYASGAAYQNYTDPTLTDWRKAYYGDAADRLTG